jgi:hypothetical protein
MSIFPTSPDNNGNISQQRSPMKYSDAYFLFLSLDIGDSQEPSSDADGSDVNQEILLIQLLPQMTFSRHSNAGTTSSGGVTRYPSAFRGDFCVRSHGGDGTVVIWSSAVCA